MKRSPVAVAAGSSFDGNWHTKVNGFRVCFSTKNVCQTAADIINEAVEKREAPLLALLAEARKTLAACRATMTNDWHNKPRIGMEAACNHTSATIAAIDAADPGEWVPAAKYRELERVLGDLKEERRDVWRERCEKALAYFAERRHAASAWDMANILEDDS